MMCHMVLYTYVKNETRAIWRKFKKHNFANLNLLSSEVKNFSRKPPCEFWDLMVYYLHAKNHENPLTLSNIRGDRQNPPPLIRISSVTSCQKCFRWHIFLLFIFTYLAHPGKISLLYQFNFGNYDRFSKDGTHKMMILQSKYCISGKYLK